MSSETRTSIRASERRRQRVVVAGVAGVAVLTAGAIAYWPGGSHDGAGSASSLALPASGSSGAPTDQAWDPTSVSTTPKAGLLLGDDPNSGTSRGMVRTPLSPNAASSSAAPSSAVGSSPGTPSSSAPSTSANQVSGQAQSGTPAPAAVPTAVPVLPSTSQPRPIIGHGTALAPETATSTATPTLPSTTTTSGTPTPTSSLPLSPTASVSLGATATATPTPTATRTRHSCVLFVVC